MGGRRAAQLFEMSKADAFAALATLKQRGTEHLSLDTYESLLTASVLLCFLHGKISTEQAVALLSDRGSVVTQADLNVEQHLRDRLTKLKQDFEDNERPLPSLQKLCDDPHLQLSKRPRKFYDQHKYFSRFKAAYEAEQSGKTARSALAEQFSTQKAFNLDSLAQEYARWKPQHKTMLKVLKAIERDTSCGLPEWLEKMC